MGISSVTFKTGELPQVKHRELVERQKREDAAGFLRPLLNKTKIVLGAGAGHKQDSKRLALDVWGNANGDLLNLTGHINEGKKSGFTLVISHHSRKPVSFENVPVVLTPNIRPGNERCNSITTPTEVLFEKTEVKGEYRAYFKDLPEGNYKLSIGDPNYNVYGNLREST